MAGHYNLATSERLAAAGAAVLAADIDFAILGR